MKSIKQIGLITMMMCFLVFRVSASGVVYVNKNATGANNGNSWADAYTTIQAGIDDADVGDEEVWVAQGTYLEAIVMKSGVKLYGGFNGTETVRSQRNWTTNVTTIDGSTARGGLPAYHVVKMDSIINSTTDGFSITGGNANGVGTNDDDGGIFCYNLNDTNIIKNNTISGNSADWGGGGIYCYSSSPAIANNTISGNSASYGGGISCYYYSSPAITNNTISGNSASWYGGGIFCSWSSPAITNNIIAGNSAIYYGGGIFCYYSSPQITNNTIAGNPASGFYGEGGGIYCYSSSPQISNNTISGNSAAWGGGGIRCGYSSSPAITNNIISGNSVYDDGGGIFYSDSSPEITNNTISGNSASYGGGIYCSYSSAQISNNIISGNLAVSHGGGIYCYSSSPAITNNTISGNSTGYGGGISCYYYSSPAITNNTISGNSAYYYGGGIFCSWSSPAITNNIIAGNSAAWGGGGIFCYYSSPNIKNTIFSNNNNYDIYEGDINSDPMVSYNDFYGNPDGVYYDEGTTPYTSVSAMDSAIAECSNNIGLNPLFVGDTLSGGSWTAAPVYNSATFQTTLTNSSAAWTANEHAGRLLNPDTSQNKQFVIVSNTATTMTVWGNVTAIAHIGDTYKIFDYHLQLASPCIDAGGFIAGLTQDFEGDPRPMDGSDEPRGDGSEFDIGADEYRARPVVNFFGAPTCGGVPLSVQFYDISYGAPTCWNWSFGDGSTSINQNPLHIYNTLGKYTVTLIANNAYGSSTISKPNYILVQDTTPPTGSIIINSGASYTNSTVVTLSLSATDAVSGVSTMRLSNDSTTWTPWESFTTSRSWYVTSGDGTKTVYVQFKDSAGNQSGSYTDTIILDMTAPSGGTVSINTGATYTRNTNVYVSWSGASDSYGIASVGLRNTISEPTTWYAYSINSTLWTLSAGYGTKTVYAVFKDNAGNVSGAVSDTIVYVATVELRVESSPETGAYITVSPADNNGISSGYTNFIRNYDQGTDVYLTAPSSYNGKPFAKWSKDGSDFSTSISIVVPMDNNHTLVAEYQLSPMNNYGEFTAYSDLDHWIFEPYGDASSPGWLGLNETYGFLAIYQIPGQKAKLSQVFAVDTGWYTAKAKVWTTIDDPAKHQKVYLYLQELDNTNSVVASGNQVVYDGSGYFPGAWQVNPVNEEMEISYFAQDTKLAVQLVAINQSYSGVTGSLCVDYIRVYLGAAQPVTINTTLTNPSFEDGTTGWILEPYGNAVIAGIWTGAYSGLILSQDSGMKGKASQNFSLNPGGPALVSAWVYSDAIDIGKSQKVYLYVYDNTSGYTQIIDSGNVIFQSGKWTPGEWHQLQFVYIPVSEYNVVQLVGINRNPADDGLWEALYFDEVVIKQE